MKIKQLDIAGFRSLKNVSWQPGDLNVVIGQNGTGKSNLLRVLELIAASAQGKLSKFIQTSGGIGSILWDGSARTISLHLQTVLSDSPSFSADEYEIQLGGFSSHYYVNQEKWLSHEINHQTLDEPPTIVIDRGSNQIIYGGEKIDAPEKISRLETLLSLLNELTFVDGVRYYPDGNTFRDQLAEIRVYHDFEVGQASKVRQATVVSFERQVETDGQNLISVLHTLYTSQREFKLTVDSAMRAAFGSDYEELVFPPAMDQQVQLRIRWKTLRREQSTADLSDGTLRFLLLLAILATPEPPSLIAIDEPETGLHPSMLPIIAEFAVEASSRTQVVFTTHSPQFLSAFGKHHPTTTVAQWENGETLLHTLDGERLKYWLEDYSLGALFESGELEAMT